MGLVSRGETDWRGKTSLLNWILINALVIIMDAHHYQTQKEACLSNFIFKALIIFMKSTMNPLSFSVAAKDENIGFDGYIGTWILRIYRIYRRYIDGYFYINIDN